MIAGFLATISLLGTWQYVGFRYEGNYYPKPNKNLVVQFTFCENQVSHLRWHREGENGFCERKADYRFEDGVLWQKVTWVNPDNYFNCSSDPDMKLGSETSTRVVEEDDLLGLVLSLKGQDFIYLLEEVKDQPGPNRCD